MAPGENVEFFMGPKFKERLRHYGLGEDPKIKEEISGQVTAWPLKRREVAAGLHLYTVTLPTGHGDQDFDVLCGSTAPNKKALLHLVSAKDGGLGDQDLAYFKTLIASLQGKRP